MPLKLAMRLLRPKKAVMAAMSQHGQFQRHDAQPRVLSDGPCAQGQASGVNCRCQAKESGNGRDVPDVLVIEAVRVQGGKVGNRMASFSGMMPNPEFYLMGRAPKAKPA